jgi:outer membrane protein TolC
MKKTLITIMSIWLVQFSLKSQNLQVFLQEAAVNNPELKAQFYRYNAVLERVDQQNALPDPTLSFGYFISPVETRVGAQDFKISISQMFPWMGTLKSKVSVATAEAQVEFEKFEEKKNELFYHVKLAYLNLYLLEKEIAIKRQDLEVLKSYEPISKTKYESNLVSLTDLIRVQIAIDHADSELEIMESKRKHYLAQFNTIVNRPLSTDVNITEMKSEGHVERTHLDSALVSHPSILRANSQINAAEERVAYSRKSRKPNIGIGLDYAFVSERTDLDVVDNGKDILMPMVSLSLPIFNKRNKAIEKEAIQMRSSANQLLIAEKNRVKSNWTEMEYSFKRSEVELDQLHKELEQTEVLLRVLLSEYSNNNSNFEELLATQQKLLQLNLAILKAEANRFKSTFLKDYLTGTTLKELRNHETE